MWPCAALDTPIILCFLPHHSPTSKPEPSSVGVEALREEGEKRRGEGRRGVLPVPTIYSSLSLSLEKVVQQEALLASSSSQFLAGKGAPRQDPQGFDGFSRGKMKSPEPRTEKKMVE